MSFCCISMQEESKKINCPQVPRRHILQKSGKLISQKESSNDHWKLKSFWKSLVASETPAILPEQVAQCWKISHSSYTTIIETLKFDTRSLKRWRRFDWQDQAGLYAAVQPKTNWIIKCFETATVRRRSKNSSSWIAPWSHYGGPPPPLGDRAHVNWKLPSLLV